MVPDALTSIDGLRHRERRPGDNEWPNRHEQPPGGDVCQAVDRAAAARKAWRTTAPAGRAAALRAAAAAVRSSADGLGDALCATTGRLLREARDSALVAADLLDEAAVAGLAGSRALAGSPGTADWMRREPHGVVAVITPWNDPFPAAAGLLAAALVTGNTVVHKPSERSLGPGMALTRVIAECLPPDVLVPLPGDAEVGRGLVAEPRIALVAHIGSSAAGQEIRAACASRGARAITENGGKDALLVDAGVDPKWAAAQIAIGAFANAGQLCTSVERVYLHREGASHVVEHLVEQAQALTPGDPRSAATTFSQLVDDSQCGHVERHVEDALARGASVLTGGTRLELGPAWYAPTVLAQCREDMLVMSEETFGPVAPLAVVESWEEGLQRAGSGRYGLAATVLTTDTAHALQAIEELEVGTVKINAVFGGAPGGSADPRRRSGSGRGYGPDLLDEMTVLKAVHWEAAPPRGTRA